MEHFANSWYWRLAFAALVAAIGYLGFAIAGERTILPVVRAGGVDVTSMGVCTTNQGGDVLYVWPVGKPIGTPAQYWVFDRGEVFNRQMRSVAGRRLPGTARGF